MKRHYAVLALLFMAVVAMSCSLAEDASSQAAIDRTGQSPTVHSYDAILRAQMHAHWSSPERRMWRIVYRPISGLTNIDTWHVEGTRWWVRIHPTVFKLDELDKSAVYEIDAVALNECYGSIEFYVYYPFPKKVSM